MKEQGKESDEELELILNWGCGEGGQLPRLINIDSNALTEPDFVESIVLHWDWEDASIDEVWLHHIIEHVSKDFHNDVFLEASRVLKPNGKIFIAYPDFEKCAVNYIENKNSKRTFWEATIYGLQRYPGDFHVCAITPRYLRSKLSDVGFSNMTFCSSEYADYYGTCLAEKVMNSMSY